MKKIYLSLAICLSVLFLSNTVSENFNGLLFTAATVTDEPTLPTTPYDYTNIEFPTHLFSDTIETGYEGGDPDTSFLSYLTDDGATLGRVLFYDKQLSATENMSCASCHNQTNSFADPVALSEGVNNETFRNSMHLNDLGWTNKAGFFWDLSQNDLHDMIVLPLQDENEIGVDVDEMVAKLSISSYYPELFEKAFGTTEITEERVVSALVQFIESMVTFESKFDIEADKGFEGFTSQESAGLEVFASSCAICHFEGASLFFGSENMPVEIMISELPFLFTNGLEIDPVDKGVGDWLDGFDGLYKVPSLRNIELTGPYMHDGRFETLDDVLDFYSDDVVATDWNFFIPDGGFQFTDTQKAELKAFLLTLTDEAFLTNPKWEDPFKTPSNVESDLLNVTITLAPNPMDAYALIKIDSEEFDYDLRVIDAKGSLVLRDKITANNYQLMKDEFNSGIYYITLSKNGKNKTLKLVVK